jgi:hypothetical protein
VQAVEKIQEKKIELESRLEQHKVRGTRTGQDRATWTLPLILLVSYSLSTFNVHRI